jgi:hypothetical protein
MIGQARDGAGDGKRRATSRPAPWQVVHATATRWYAVYRGRPPRAPLPFGRVRPMFAWLTPASGPEPCATAQGIPVRSLRTSLMMVRR